MDAVVQAEAAFLAMHVDDVEEVKRGQFPFCSLLSRFRCRTRRRIVYPDQRESVNI